jgi:hypothetical protein
MVTVCAGEVWLVPAGFCTVQVIVMVPGLPAVSEATTVAVLVVPPEVMVGDVPEPATDQVKVPACAGTLAVKLTPAVAVAGAVTVTLGGG